tara:strand:+ start:231 stop:437 length:207 start_codon:yes stop_codon:yes gene_type:complete
VKIIYCQCGKKTELQKGEAKECKCGKVFGVRSGKISDYINMRTTWSGQTKVEFSQTTIDQDIKDRNSR